MKSWSCLSRSRWIVLLVFILNYYNGNAQAYEDFNDPVSKLDGLIQKTKSQVENALKFLRDHTDEKKTLPACDILNITCANGSIFKRRADGCFVASGPNPEHEVITLQLKPLKSGKILRLDFPLDKSLRRGGPGRSHNGNFAISEIEILGFKAGSVWANSAEAPCFAEQTIDGIKDNPENCWNADAFRQNQRTLFLVLSQAIPAGKPLTVRITSQSKWGEHVPGCISASVLSDESILKAIPLVSQAEQTLRHLEKMRLLAMVQAFMRSGSGDYPAKLILNQGESIVAIGDSITAAGGYLRTIHSVLQQEFPELKIPKIINKGIGGQKAEDLLRRFDRDVIQLKPAVVTICIGINDVWHRLNGAHQQHILDAYKRNVSTMVERAQKAGIHVVLLTPTVIREDINSEGNKRLALYVKAKKEIANEKQCQIVDLHGLFLTALNSREKVVGRGWLTGDGVHMSPLGDTLMAAGTLRGLGLSDSQFTSMISNFGGQQNQEQLTFTNSLSMEFVPVKAVPGVLFSKWETRVKDFAVFIEETKRDFEKPNFPQGGDHPVVNVSYNNAMEFCKWLSKKEGRTYRLPKDHEWSGAIGIGTQENDSEFPKFKSIEAPKNERVKIAKEFPWGESWPPPNGVGNIASSFNSDSFKFTSPVGSFKPTKDGLYDLTGNAWEWCDSIYEDKEHYRVLRGGSWRFDNSLFLLSAFRGRGNTPTRFDSRGFRVVLEVGRQGQALLKPTKRIRPKSKTHLVYGISRLIQQLNKGKAQTIVTYGTSLTSGGAWVKQLEAQLKAKWPGLIKVVNSGRGGMWSKWGVDNLQDRVIAKKPDTLLIEFGINDAYLPYKTSVEQARMNLINMIDRVHEANKHTEIILMTMNMPVGVHLARRPQINKYYQMYREVAKERKLKLIDHARNWLPVLRDDRSLFDKYVPDGIHPGELGCEKVITPGLVDALGVPKKPNNNRIKVLLVGGRGSHDWHGFHDTIEPLLTATGDFDLRLTPNVDDLNTKNLAQHDLVLFYGPGGNFTDKSQEEALHDYVKNGGGLAGVHATDAFKKSDVYWRLLGGRFVTHRGGEFMIRIMDKEHPITAPFGDFKIHDETYANEYHPDFKLHSLFRMDRGREQQSMGWVQDYGKGRVFNTTLGHEDSAWRNPGFQQILVRGLYWAAGRELR